MKTIYCSRCAENRGGCVACGRCLTCIPECRADCPRPTLTPAVPEPAPLQIVRDADLPEEFQAANMYRELDKSIGLSDRFKQWCTDNRVYYYARPAEKFFESEACELAAAAGCTRLLLENMS